MPRHLSKIIFFIAIFLSIFLFAPKTTLADHPSHGPFSLRSQNPLYLLFLTPRPERARVLPKGQLRLAARGPYSNIFERESSFDTGVAVDLDMELFRPSFLMEWGFLPAWEFGFELPFLHFDGGFLDAFIQDFHSAFGFPNAGRESVPNGRFNYSVSQGGNTLYSTGTQTFGLSDIVLHVKREFLQESAAVPALAGTLYLKIPTGKKGQGLGSGAPDIGFNLSLEKNYKRLHSYANLGGVLMGATDIGLEDFLNPALWTWMVALELTAWANHLGVIAQLQGDGSLFDKTGVQSLDQGNFMLTIGLAGQEGSWGWKAAFAEDPSGQGPTVDFTVYFEVSYTWGMGP
jgi:hypothetical protein